MNVRVVWLCCMLGVKLDSAMYKNEPSSGQFLSDCLSVFHSATCCSFSTIMFSDFTIFGKFVSTFLIFVNIKIDA